MSANMTPIESSPPQLSDPARPAPRPVRPREPQLCHVVPAGLGRRRRRFHLVPLLLGAAARVADAAVGKGRAAHAAALLPAPDTAGAAAVAAPGSGWRRRPPSRRAASVAAFSAVSGQHLRNGGTTLALAQYDVGKYAVEGLASSDGGLLGLRGIYNFGGDAEKLYGGAETAATVPDGTGEQQSAMIGITATPKAQPPNGEKERIYGRFSTGAEIYYGTLNKSGGISLATRFATLPSHRGTPLTATLTLNPLMGSVGASYAVVAGRHCTLATRMEFNVFSYESAWAVGMELWRKPFTRPPPDENDPSLSPSPTPASRAPERSFRAKMEWRLDDADPHQTAEADGQRLLADRADAENAAASGSPPSAGWQQRRRKQSQGTVVDEAEELHQPGWKAQEEEYAGVLKARFDQNLRIGLLWEGRVKSLLFSLGSGIDLRHMDKPFRTLGLEIQFSS
ncbi:distribution and morphology protein 10 [Beauveria bassiana D1-5]|uniref:Distribution and morphology protein 10 n=1 Tax=Beauveria bassiana D1-5 TaxID=1245745 RepID=A0A0A2W2E7_BEABA|nr:distribution and morphology protein 10 [Beauveria bassiana D1-5]